MSSATKKFRAHLEKGSRALGWTIVRVPFDPAATWKNLVRFRVRGEINGHPFRTSLFPEGNGSFHLLVNRAMQSAAQVHLGDTAEILLEPDLEPRPAELPDCLSILLDEEPGLRDFYDTFSESTRREIGKWVVGVKSEEAQLRRAEQMAERLLATMDAEQELPPAIQAAFLSRPKAGGGWAKMTPLQRRNELLGVFYYRTPESRQKRIEKLCDLAERHVRKGALPQASV